MYLVLQTPGGAGTLKNDCEAGSTTKTLSPGSQLAAFTVTLRCSSATYTEGGSTVRLYSIVSNACNEPDTGVCPNATTTSATYVDREVRASVTN